MGAAGWSWIWVLERPRVVACPHSCRSDAKRTTAAQRISDDLAHFDYDCKEYFFNVIGKY